MVQWKVPNSTLHTARAHVNHTRSTQVTINEAYSGLWQSYDNTHTHTHCKQSPWQHKGMLHIEPALSRSPYETNSYADEI